MSELVTWAQVCARTGSPEAARRAIRSGTYFRVRRGSYLPSEDTPADPAAHHRLLIAATVPRLGSTPVLAIQSAALVLGIPLVVAVPDTVQIAEARRSGGRSTGRVTRHSTVGDLPTTTTGGLTVTTGARTAVDLARCCGLRQGVVAADHVLRTGLATRAEMQAVVDQLAGAHGIKAARTAVEFADARAESAGESISRLLMDELGFVAPDLQVELVVKGRRYRSDFGWGTARCWESSTAVPSIGRRRAGASRRRSYGRRSSVRTPSGRMATASSAGSGRIWIMRVSVESSPTPAFRAARVPRPDLT